jgi:uncharacterized SAM-binding protein YcdF (DUF218 family)
LLAVCAALLAVAWLFRAPLLVGLAKAWIVDDPLTRSDVIVVLGGGPSTRPFEAARLFQQGFASKVLTMKGRMDPAAKLGSELTCSGAEKAGNVQQGVADANVVCSDDEVANTYEESIAVRNWSRTNHVKTMIIVTDSFNPRRVRWLFHKQLKDTGVHVSCAPCPCANTKPRIGGSTAGHRRLPERSPQMGIIG